MKQTTQTPKTRTQAVFIQFLREVRCPDPRCASSSFERRSPWDSGRVRPRGFGPAKMDLNLVPTSISVCIPIHWRAQYSEQDAIPVSLLSTAEHRLCQASQPLLRHRNLAP